VSLKVDTCYTVLPTQMSNTTLSQLSKVLMCIGYSTFYLFRVEKAFKISERIMMKRRKLHGKVFGSVTWCTMLNCIH